MKFRGRAARLEVNPMGGSPIDRALQWLSWLYPASRRATDWMEAKGSLFPRRLESQNSRLSTTSIEASTIRAATAKLARIPGHGRCFPRRKVFLSIEKSPVTSRQALKRGIQLSNTNTERSTTPNATAGAVYSPTTNDETKTAIAK